MSEVSFSAFGALGSNAGRSSSTVTVGHATRTDWRPAPINPSWIIAGDPVAHYIPIGVGEDGYSSLSLWRCTEGSFRWTFGWEESVYITGGVVEIVAADGQTDVLEAGSVALFQAGSTSVWTVRQPVQKMAVCRRALNPRLAKIVRFIRRPWSLPALVIALAEWLPTLEPVLV
ncbi:cupin domain-containing protein [Mesorhizobium sp. BR1-1-16]|uniref:cupin domain-containing protein n=1 Tax=Mesorhizobium sp. BR1-1-16 TaxID=2876653 RepID=UPI001CCF39AD|nr:cupin domain-containing protein [Mesorhizobium sp. BR1-1-16]MBZ9935985.1 cupin domain-containing protein [Mesorhizobium sp. BR1-1-16]